MPIKDGTYFEDAQRDIYLYRDAYQGTGSSTVYLLALKNSMLEQMNPAHVHVEARIQTGQILVDSGGHFVKTGVAAVAAVQEWEVMEIHYQKPSWPAGPNDNYMVTLAPFSPPTPGTVQVRSTDIYANFSLVLGAPTTPHVVNPAAPPAQFTDETYFEGRLLGDIYVYRDKNQLVGQVTETFENLRTGVQFTGGAPHTPHAIQVGQVWDLSARPGMAAFQRSGIEVAKIAYQQGGFEVEFIRPASGQRCIYDLADILNYGVLTSTPPVVNPGLQITWKPGPAAPMPNPCAQINVNNLTFKEALDAAWAAIKTGTYLVGPECKIYSHDAVSGESYCLATKQWENIADYLPEVHPVQTGQRWARKNDPSDVMEVASIVFMKEHWVVPPTGAGEIYDDFMTQRALLPDAPQKKVIPHWNTTCRKCGSEAYLGLNLVTCSRGCR